MSSGDIPALLTLEAEGRCLLLSGSPAGVKGKICHKEKLQVRRPKLHVHVVIGKREGRGACFESSCSVHVPQNKATHYSSTDSEQTAVSLPRLRTNPTPCTPFCPPNSPSSSSSSQSPSFHSGNNAFRFTPRSFLNRRSTIIIIMADDESTTPTPPPPPPHPAPATTAAATAAATASSWFGSLGTDIGKALETAREQVVKAAEVRR